jgi:thioredoxin 1
MKPVVINDLNFKQEVLDSTVPVLVDFWAPWCAPCHMIAPTIEEFAAEFHGKIKIAKMNTDENQTPTQYGIRSIPTLLLYRDGKVVDQIIGSVSKSFIREKLNYYAQGIRLLN